MRVQRNPAHGNRHRCACPAAKSFLLCRAWRRGCKILSLILEIHYDNYTEKFGKKWAWRLKETISVLGKNFEQALWFAAQVPEAPDEYGIKGHAVCSFNVPTDQIIEVKSHFAQFGYNGLIIRTGFKPMAISITLYEVSVLGLSTVLTWFVLKLKRR
jgi:hypothetical protein